MLTFENVYIDVSDTQQNLLATQVFHRNCLLNHDQKFKVFAIHNPNDKEGNILHSLYPFKDIKRENPPLHSFEHNLIQLYRSVHIWEWKDGDGTQKPLRTWIQKINIKKDVRFFKDERKTS